MADHPDADCRAVEQIASKHLKLIEARIASLQQLADELRAMVAQCRGGRAAKEESQARLRGMEADERERRLIPAAEVESVLAVAFASVAQALLNLLDTLERAADMSAQAAEKAIHAAMDGLAADLQALGLEDSAP